MSELDGPDSLTPASQRGTIAYLAVAGVQRAAAFVTLPIFAAALTPADFGVVAVLVSANALVATFLPLGMETFVYRTAFAPDADGMQKERLRTVVSFLVLGPVASSAVLACVALALPSLLDTRPLFLASALLTAGLTTSATVAPYALLRAEERFSAYAVLSLGYAGVQLLLRLVLVIALDRGVGGMVLADLLAAALAGAAGAVSARSLLTVRGMTRRYLREGLRFGLPLVPHSASHWVLNLSDRLVMAAYLSPARVGIYSVTYQIASVASIAVTEVERAFLPRYGEVLRGTRRVGGIVAQQAGTVVGLCGFVALAGPQVILLVLPASYEDGARYVPLLALGFVWYGLYYVPMNSLVILKADTSRLWRWTAMSGAINVALNVTLVPVIGMVAGAIATIVGYAVLLALVVRAAGSDSGEHPFDWRQMLRPVLPGLAITMVFSLGAVRPGLFGTACAVAGCCLLGGVTWISAGRGVGHRESLTSPAED